MDLTGLSGAARGTADLAQITSPERLGQSIAGRPAAEVAKSFESLFATMLVKEMRRALPEGFFGAGTDGDVYGGWLDQTIGEAIAKSGALKLSEKVRSSIEGAPQPQATQGESP